MNQLPLNKNELPLVREILTKYKQGYISGLIPGSNITFAPSGCRNKIVSSTGSGGGGSSYIPPFLKTGGASWSGTGLVYDVTTLEYYFNGDKLAAATQVTLDASDPVNNRLDAIVVDEAGVVSVIKGDASASPISPSVDESHILIQYILVEAGSTQPTIAKEDIYLENVEWTTSTYTTGTATGSIDFDNAVSPKQGVKCISANADARLGARFVRATSFDPYQYTMLSMWVRFTGSNVANNKSLNVRFENGAGSLVANTINLFNFGLQRNLLNVWQLIVIPITSFGALPTSVKGLKIIMTGGTVGQARQWDIDLISLTDNSVPAINEQIFNVLKDGALVGQSSSLNFKGAAVNVTEDTIGGKIDIEVVASNSVKLSDITAATSAHTIDNGDKTQTWTWNSISGQSGLKLSSTANGTTSNKTQKLFESVLTGAMFDTSNSSYAGYFDNQQTLGGACGIYARGYTAAQLEGIVNINGALNVNNLQIRNNSGVSYIIPSSNQKLVIGGGGDAVQNSLNGCATAFSISAKTSGSKYVYGMGMVYQFGAYISESTTNILIERDGGNMLLSANAGLVGGFNTFTPTYQIAIAGATNNVGIGTLTPNSSAKLDVSSTTQGFAPPEMTATQASAISTTSRKLIIYVTDTNVTFTSAGLWMWTGTTWKLILAE